MELGIHGVNSFATHTPGRTAHLWTSVVAMNTDGSRPVAVSISVAAALPSCPGCRDADFVRGAVMLT